VIATPGTPAIDTGRVRVLIDQATSPMQGTSDAGRRQLAEELTAAYGMLRSLVNIPMVPLAEQGRLRAAVFHCDGLLSQGWTRSDYWCRSFATRLHYVAEQYAPRKDGESS
jgi:hypothetical protein